MKENKYDDPGFFELYGQMERSVKGLEGAGEWHVFRKLMPDLHGRNVLDIGCGMGWHCAYASDNGAKTVLGIDISGKMLEKAREINARPNIRYEMCALEDMKVADNSFDIVLSSLTFHYTPDFREVADKVYKIVAPGGSFLFSVEHPAFTAEGSQQWVSDADGNNLHWPVDRYFEEGERDAVFLEVCVKKYHRTLTTYINTLLEKGFVLDAVVEPTPSPELLDVPGMRDELRRPMMLVISAKKG